MNAASDSVSKTIAPGYAEPWRAVPRTPFDYELVISIECTPRTLPSAIAMPIWKALKTAKIGKKNIGLEFKRAGMQIVEDIKSKYGHAAFMRREDGKPVETHEGLEICGYLPYFRQRELKLDGQLDYRLDMDVAERWKNLVLYRRTYPGAISDDSDQQPVSAVALAVSKYQFDRIPARVAAWSEGKIYHAIGKRAENCWVVPLRVLADVGVRIPCALSRYLTPDEVDRDIRNGVLAENLRPSRDRIALIRPASMKLAIDGYIEKSRRQSETYAPTLALA